MLEEELQEIGVSDKIRPVSLLILDEGVVESLIKEAWLIFQLDQGFREFGEVILERSVGLLQHFV